jgi:hypothetical protein
MRPIINAIGFKTRKPASRVQITEPVRASFNSRTGRIDGPMALMF